MLLQFLIYVYVKLRNIKVDQSFEANDRDRASFTLTNLNKA